MGAVCHALCLIDDRNVAKFWNLLIEETMRNADAHLGVSRAREECNDRNYVPMNEKIKSWLKSVGGYLIVSSLNVVGQGLVRPRSERPRGQVLRC